MRLTAMKMPAAGAIGIAAVLLPVAVAPSAIAAPAASTAASVTCYGDYCSGQDPETTGCAADAQTVEWYDLSGARLELRFSPRCQTEWAKWIQYPVGHLSDLPTAIAAVQDTGYTQSLDFDVDGLPVGSQHDPSTPTPAGTYWTSMIYSPVHVVKAVATIQCGGDMSLIGAAFDCAMNGKVETPAY